LKRFRLLMTGPNLSKMSHGRFLMAMTEKWIPSPNYSSGRGPYNKIVLHTTEGAQTIEALGSFFGSASAGVSSHFGADNRQRGIVGAYVKESDKAWTQGNANPYCLSMELCTPSGAAAKWTRDYWLNSQTTLVRNAADWVAWMAGKYGIPIRALTPSQAQDPNYKGVCQHKDFGSWGGNHSDCGSGFPMDKIIEWAKGGSPAPTPSGGAFMSCSVAYYEGRAFYAYVDLSGKVCVNGSAVDPNSFAVSGAGIAIDPANGRKTVSYTNKENRVCVYEQAKGSNNWAWANKGWPAK
jgi:hypothetical protein